MLVTVLLSTPTEGKDSLPSLSRPRLCRCRCQIILLKLPLDAPLILIHPLSHSLSRSTLDSHSPTTRRHNNTLNFPPSSPSTHRPGFNAATVVHLILLFPRFLISSILPSSRALSSPMSARILRFPSLQRGSLHISAVDHNTATVS